MPEKLQEELSQLTDEEIEKRLAAAVWVDDKRAAVLRYLEDKKLDRKKEAQVAELEAARSAKDAAWAAVDAAKVAQRTANLAHGGGGLYRRSGRCSRHSLCEAPDGLVPRAISKALSSDRPERNPNSFCRRLTLAALREAPSGPPLTAVPSRRQPTTRCCRSCSR